MKALPMILASGLLAACASQPANETRHLEGEVFYLQRMALLPAATLSVSLQDVSLADAPAVELARQNGPIQGQVPLPFRLDYDPAKVQPDHRYAVSARIELDGRLMFINTEQHSVKLDGSDPQPLRVKVDPVR
ncbi:YbaY family lipoprotein [Pseudomonas sp. JM0905a]|uniref:YbaY family lipoprotein n=1 Tax=Pseudomonas sp. JM0905a TaxID=2772484 RepID=UPI0016847787|nr:YbaY family lipoprotein [Pseudomonas sp. JM0905a]MBD2838141.1 YbaY family lipoprotein [Pseudomonas sp. JM0905a]